MNYSHHYCVPGFKSLENQLLAQDSQLIPVVSAVREMAYLEAEHVFYSLVDSVKPAVLSHPLRLAVSFGKDSTFLLAVFVEAYRQLILDNQTPKAPLIVTHVDTRIESPVMSLYANRQINELKIYLAQSGIPHEIYTATPPDRYSWPVMYVGGLKLITVGASKTADCSIELKQRPLKAVESVLAKKYGDIVTVTGVRSSESLARKQKIQELGLDKGTIVRTDKNGVISLDYAPISHVTTEDVWMVLRCLGEGAGNQYGRHLPYWSKSTWYLSKLYADQADSNCPIVGSGVMSSERSSGCSSSMRSGCSLCTQVNIDKQAEVLSDLAQYPQLKNLLAIRNWLSHTYFDMNYRRFIGRKFNNDGYVKIEPETFNEAWLSLVLRWLLQADADEMVRADNFRTSLKTEVWMQDLGVQAILSEDIPGWQKIQWIAEYIEDMQNPTFEMVSATQLLMIDVMWSRDGYRFAPFSALNIWHEVHHLGIRTSYPVIEGKRIANNIPAPRYMYIGNHPNFPDVADFNNTEFMSRFIHELDSMELTSQACGVETKPRLITSSAIVYGEHSGRSFDGWFGDFESKPLVVGKQDEDDSGYTIDIEAAEMITSLFMIRDYIKIYKNSLDEMNESGRFYRSNYAMNRLIREGVLRLSPQAQRNSARLAARAWLYEDVGLLDICRDVQSGEYTSSTISESEYKSISSGCIVTISQSLPEFTLLQQLADIKAAAKSVRELYNRLCASRSAAMLSVSEMGVNFVFDGRAYQGQVAMQSTQIQEIIDSLTTVFGLLSLLPKNAPLRQQKALPLNVHNILSDFASQLKIEFQEVEKTAWSLLLKELQSEVIEVNNKFSVVLGAGGMSFIKNAQTALQFVKSQIAIRSLKKAS